MTGTNSTATGIVEIEFCHPQEMTETERAIAEHQRRQAIEDVRFWDRMLYGRSDKTIPKRVR